MSRFVKFEGGSAPADIFINPEYVVSVETLPPDGIRGCDVTRIHAISVCFCVKGTVREVLDKLSMREVIDAY